MSAVQVQLAPHLLFKRTGKISGNNRGIEKLFLFLLATPFASDMSSRISSYQEDSHECSFSPDEILSLMDENEKHWISEFEDERSRILHMNFPDGDLPF